MINETSSSNAATNIPSPKHILLTGSFAQRIAEEIKRMLSCPEAERLTLRVCENPDSKNWEWADTWVGMHLPDNGKDFTLPWYHLICDGYNHVAKVLTPKAENGSLITHTVGQMPTYIGTWVASYLLAELRRHREYRQQQEQQLWKQLSLQLPADFPTLIIGTGGVAQGVAKSLKSLGFKVSGANTSGRNPGATLHGELLFDEVYALAELGEKLGDFAVIVLALPLTPNTRNIINREFFRHCRNVILFNVGRGPTLCPDSLREALENGQVSQAYLDVFETEPLTEGDWRWSHPQVTVTPHVSGPTVPRDGAQAFIEVYRAICAADGVNSKRENLPLQIDVSRGY